MDPVLQRGRALVLALRVVSIATVAAVLLEAPAPLRAPLVLTFVLLCPGAAVVRLLGLRDAAASVVLSIAVSLALGMLVTEAMAVGHAWSAEAAVIDLAAFTVALTLVPPLGRRAQFRSSEDAPPQRASQTKEPR